MPYRNSRKLNRKFIQQLRSRQLLKKLNLAYAGPPDPAEQVHLSRMKLKQRQLVEYQW